MNIMYIEGIFTLKGDTVEFGVMSTPKEYAENHSLCFRNIYPFFEEE